jgi:hypothetical protein
MRWLSRLVGRSRVPAALIVGAQAGALIVPLIIAGIVIAQNTGISPILRAYSLQRWT